MKKAPIGYHGISNVKFAIKEADAYAADFIPLPYPGTVYGDPLMDDKGAKPYIDELGMGRLSFLYTARPDDEGYDTFGDAVPVPKVKPVAPPSGG